MTQSTPSINELKSYTEYNVSTPTSVFTIGFQYEYNVDHVNVYVDGVEATAAGYTIQHDSQGTVQLTPAVPSGVVRLQRETDIDASAHSFSAGAKFTAGTMDENFTQIRHSQQEMRDNFFKLKDDIGFTNLEQTIQAVNNVANAVNTAATQVQQDKDTAVVAAGVAADAADTADAANTAAQQVLVDVSRATSDVYTALDTQQTNINAALSAQQIAVNNSLTAIAGGHKAYQTLAAAQAAQASLPANTVVEVTNDGANNGTYQWNGTTLTKSAYDPLTQAKNYTNTFVNTRNNLADSFLYSGVLTNTDDLNPLTKDGVYVATSTPINAPLGETGQALIRIEKHAAFTMQTYQRINDSRRVWRRVIQAGQTPEVWRDLSFIGDANIATTSKVGTVKPSTGLAIASDGSLSVANLARAQFADDFTYVSTLNATNDLNIKMKEGSYLTLAVPLNAPTGINPNVLITNQNVGQRYIQTIYDLNDSRKRWQRVVRFNSDGVFISAEVWQDLFQIPRAGLTDNFLYAGVLTSSNDVNTVLKHGVYIATSAPVNSPIGTPAITIVEVSGSVAFVKQKITDAFNAAISWTRTFQTTNPIAGGVWVSNNPADHIATTSKVGGVKVGAGLNVTPDGTLSVIAPSQINPFAGKKVVCFGDSITEFKTYPQQLGQMLGAEGINVGFGGCMMSAHWDVGYKEMCMYRLADYIASGDYSGLIAAAQDVYDRTGDDNRAIASRLAAIDWNTVDYITILYGTNDFANGKALGSATETVSDGSNYLGSANYAIQRLQTAYPHLKIALITPIYRARGANGGTDSDDSPNAATNGKYLREFAAGLIEVAKLNHIPSFNMYDESGINKYTKGLYLNPDPDGVHLTEVGATHLAQKIAAKMRANF